MAEGQNVAQLPGYGVCGTQGIESYVLSYAERRPRYAA